MLFVSPITRIYFNLALIAYISFLVAGCSCSTQDKEKKSSGVDSSAATVISAAAANGEASKALANAFPGSLALSLFPKPAAAGPHLKLSDDNFDPNGKSLQAKIADQEALLQGTADSCLPAALGKTVNVEVETCYDFDQDMLYGTKDIGQTPIQWLGTKNGTSSSGEACLVAFARAQAASVNALLDQTLGMGMAALCQQKKDNPHAVLPVPNAPLDLGESLQKLLGSGVTVSSATFKQLANKGGFPVYRILIAATLGDGIKRSIGVRHSPHNSSNSEFSGSVYLLAEGVPGFLGLDDGKGESKFQLMSITYARAVDPSSSVPTLRAELRTAHVAASLASTAITSEGVLDLNAGSNFTLATLGDESYGSYSAYSQPNDAMDSITYLAFSLNPESNEGKLSYWKNSGGGYYENARGFTITLGTPSPGGELSGCVASGTASTDLNRGTSIRRFLNEAEAANNLALTPVGFWHPLMNTPRATGSDSDGTYKIKTLPSGQIAKWYVPSGGNSTFNDFYSSAISGTLQAQQCFILSPSATTYAVDTSKTPEPSGFAMGDTTDDGDLAKFVVAPVPQVDASTSSTAPTYTIAGTISGLVSSGLVLSNKTGDTLKIDAGASSFSFVTATSNTSTEQLTVSAQPSVYTCTLSSTAATITAGNVSGISVSCRKNTYAISGTISGLGASGLLLQNNLGANLSVAAGSSSFTFTSAVATGDTYSVSIAALPTDYSCSIAGGSGKVLASAISNVAITCARAARTIGGSISGLGASGLTLKNNGGDTLTVPANATQFVFSTTAASGSTYAVTIASQPSGYVCTASSNSGTVSTTNISTVAITCAANFSVGGTISGLGASGLVLKNNAGDNLSVSSGATSFTFSTKLTATASYAVTIDTQATGYFCTLSNGTGTIASSNISNVALSCVAQYTIGGTISGLGAAGLLLQNNGGDNLSVASGASSFTFATKLTTSSSYAVTISTQPSGYSCTVASGSGSVASSNITSVSLSCAAYAASSASVTATVAGGFKIYTFNSNGTFTVGSGGAISVDYLVVAGGGGGGCSNASNGAGGGGGAGGVLTGTMSSLATGTYTISVGSGATTCGANNFTGASNGSNSSVSGTGLTTITAVGGGGGGTANSNASFTAAQVGGSGGGGSYLGTGASGTASQGYAGGNGYSASAGGGGGAGGTPTASTTDGGTGISSSISGSSVCYGGGGGGYSNGSGYSTSAHPGVVCGGAYGKTNDGSANRGGGGSSYGGAGGSGVIILKSAN